MNKETIYKKYLNNELSEAELIKNLDNLQNKSVKDNGVIYTPLYIVNHMINKVEIDLNMNILEPSCGHGIFLLEILKYISNKYELKGEKLFEWFINKVDGVEISLYTVNELKEVLSLYFLKNFSIRKKPEDFINIHNFDGLTFNLNKKYDICIGNPPYIRAKNLNVDYLSFLKKNFNSCKKGTIDIYFAFIEKYIKEINAVIFIVPNSFLSSKSGNIIKNELINDLIYLIDFKDKKVFDDASVYTCIFLTNKNLKNNKIEYGNELNNNKIINKKILFNQVENNEKGIDNVLSGIATLCDNVYIVKKEGNKFVIKNNISFEIEKEMVVPYLKLTKIKTNKDIDNIDYMIYPYKDKKVINEEDLKNKYPLTYNYLLNVKNKLLQRDKGKTSKYESWYAYGRKQGLHDIKSNELLIIPSMIGAECKPIEINVNNLLKEYKTFVFTSGFIIEKNKDNDVLFEKILGNDFVEYAQKNGKIWPGKTESYYSLNTGQIKKYKI